MTLPPDLVPTLPTWHAALLFGPAVVAGLAAFLAGLSVSTAVAWRGARGATSVALLLAALSMAAVPAGSAGSGLGVRADAAGSLVMLLAAFVAWVIVRYSQTCMDGERGEGRYLRWLMATVATVFVVVATNHLLVLFLAWTATSLALHRLLTFYGDRPQAVAAAHKKFIVGRAADVCMLAAAGLLFHAFGTWHIDELIVRAAAAAPWPWAVQAAVVLIAGAALLKCAQLPFHGWLIQVMEAPTPVSALLHAGVVNLGGFVLIRLAPLVAESPAAQALLVIAGTTTAVMAALVMATRSSIKVMLAWSTCAQMGFMLMQCGLGAWEMALVHLVAHSLYKAHAFLGAGGAVRSALRVRLTPQAAAPGPFGLAAGALVGLGMVLAAAAAVRLAVPEPTASPVTWVLGGIVALALVPLVHAQTLRLGGRWLPALGLGAFGVALACFGLHALFATWLLPAAPAPATALWVGVAVAFGALFLLQCLITVAPHGAVARRLYPLFHGGLFLDERFNRSAFALWRPPAPAHAASVLPLADTAACIGHPMTPNPTATAAATTGARA